MPSARVKLPSRTTTVGAPPVSSSPASASITSVNPAALSEILPGMKVVSAGIGSLKTLFVAVPAVVTSTVTPGDVVIYPTTIENISDQAT